MESPEQESMSPSESEEEAPVTNEKLLAKNKRKLKGSNEEPLAKKTKNKNDLFKPPTIEELNNLKLTENLYNNNLFRLQIEELVKEISIKPKRHKAFAAWFDSFSATLEKLPEMEFQLSDMKNKAVLKLVKSLGSDPSKLYKIDEDLTIKLHKPDKVEKIGLYENNSLAGPNLEAEINIKIPKVCFYLKDYLNNRYLVKRCWYLAYIANNLTVHSKKLVFHEDNVLLPVLQVQPSEDEKLIVKIYVSPSDECFKPSRLLPNVNNVKKDLFNLSVIDEEIVKSTPTVLYNSALAHDVTMSENSLFVKTMLSDQTNIQEGIKLINIWLKQRELNVGYGAFTHNLTMYFIVYLLSKKKINKFMSSYQIVRNFWSFLSTTDFQSTFLSLGNSSGENFELFRDYFKIIILDKTNCYNLASFLDENVFERVKVECQLALRHLDNSRIESFQSLFLTKLPFALQYDLVIDVTESVTLLKDHVQCSDEDKVKHAGYGSFFLVQTLLKVLRQGLNDRITLMVPHVAVTAPTHTKTPIVKLLIGIKLNIEKAFHFMEKGPELWDALKADEFRQFWGYLSSDRRFRDGSTHVAVYFKTSTIKGKRGIIKRIIKYVLAEKLNLKFHMHYDEFDQFLQSKNIDYPYIVGTTEEACLKLVGLADELGQKIRSMALSLSITGIQGTSDAFSYTEAFPPVAAQCKSYPKRLTGLKAKNLIFSFQEQLKVVPRYVEPIEMVLQLEHSSKWPTDLEAIRYIKTSFYLEIGKILQESHNIVNNVTKEYLQVYYGGLVFRYKLYVPKEIALMKKEVTKIGTTIYKENEMSFEYEKTLNILPKLNAAFKGLQMQFPSFGPGAALVKRWLRSHLIDDFHFPNVVINLLNASLYVNLTSFMESCTPQISFLRFLKFISEFQWELQPVIVNFNDEISKEDLEDLESKFQQNRAAIQSLYIITPYDQGQSLFTKHSPTKEILLRVQQLAQVSLQLIIEQVVGVKTFDVKDLFKANTEGYDVLIHLKPSLIPRKYERIDSIDDDKLVLKPYAKQPNETCPIVGFDPVEEYLKTLRDNYGEFAAFFHDTYGGCHIGVLWNPKAKESRDFKVGYAGGRKVVGNKLELNREGLIEDFFILGRGIVEWIQSEGNVLK